MFEIQNNIPVPEITRKRNNKYPWHAMQVGDSFFVANLTTKGFAGTCYSAGKRSGQKFTARAVDGGIRIWRTA